MILHNSIRVAQNLSRRDSHAQINRVRLTYGHRNPLNHLNYSETQESANLLILLNSVESTESAKHEQYSGSPEHQHYLGSEVPTNNVESLLYEVNQQRTVLHRNPDLAYERVVPQSHEVNLLSLSEPDNQPSLTGETQRLCGSLCPAQDLYTEINGAQDLQVTKCHLQNRLSQRESVDGIAGSNPFQPFGSSFASLRWRRLISPCMAELMNCPVLSPGFFTCSMPSMISCAMRAVTDCDFAFFEPVAMSTFSKNECKTLYTKIYCLEVLTCKTPLPYRVSYTLFELRCENSEARQCGNTNRASDHQDS